MGRKDKKSTLIIASPPPPPPPPTYSSSSSDHNDAVSSSASSSDDDDNDVSSDSPPPKSTSITLFSKQPRSKPITTPGSPAPSFKRPAVPDITGSSKRVKKDPSSGPTLTPQKVLFQRVWSAEDELVILKGMIDYKVKKGFDPMTNVDDFLEFIKNSLHLPDANRAQIVSKVRRLKNRFINAKKKKKKLSDPHEIKAFELSKMIWLGPELGDENDEDKKEKAAKTKVNNGELVVVVEEEKGKGCFGNVGVELGFDGEDGVVLKKGLMMMEEGERGEIRRMVEKANVAYLDAYLLRLKALMIAANKILDGIKNDQC